MQKTILTIVMGVLCLIFKAEAQINKAVDLTSKGIQIGQKVPDVLLNNIYNYKATTAKLSDFKDKLIILDFWATWCGACISMMPKLEKLQNQFSNQLQILPVTYQTEAVAVPYLEKRHKTNPSALPYVIADTKLHKLFPHKVLPHYVWIDSAGIVLAITGLEEITIDNIQNIIKGERPVLRQKKDLNMVFDKSKPYLINGNGGNGSNLIFHSLFTSYQPGLTSGINSVFDPSKGRKLFMRNVSIGNLFYMALGGDNKFFDNKRAIFEVKDQVSLHYNYTVSPDLEEWRNENLYCYNLIVPAKLYNDFFDMMRADVRRFFPQYTVSTTMKSIPSIVLIRTSTIDKLKAKDSQLDKIATSNNGCEIVHGSLNVLVKRLDMVYMHAPVPVINGTGINYPIDLTLKVDFANLDELNNALLPYDVKFVKKDWPVEHIVFRDTKK